MDIATAAGEDDVALVARSLAGDTHAYAALMRRHFDDAFAIARRLTETAEDAEDACQEAFARAYFRLAECGDPVRFGEWLRQIVRHQAHNVRRYQTLRATLPLDEVHAAATDDPALAAELTELREKVRLALGRLTPTKRAVFRHHEVDGWTHAQIARALAISTLMSRRHLSDARAALREALGDFMTDSSAGTEHD